MVIGVLLMAIGGHFINGYWWLLVAILLMAIGVYSIVNHWRYVNGDY
jgi:hypothetical protein